MHRVEVLGVELSALGMAGATKVIVDWARAGESRYVCLCNAHSLVTAVHDPEHREALAQADLVAPDGASVAWLMAATLGRFQPRVAGPDLMLSVCSSAALQGVKIYLLGGTPLCVASLAERLAAAYPTLTIAGGYSPPFGEWTLAEEQDIVGRISSSGAQIVWVGMGCPKQEAWMGRSAHAIRAVLVGVGAAFDYHSGMLRRAPKWMQSLGLEWIHRLWTEPRRLWKRYLVTNTVFVWYAVVHFVRRVFMGAQSG
jgi:N-acetylglucosaminyldiphosphoundecaprenol N-acetyl-beta-D-mannosaminyltransferase